MVVFHFLSEHATAFLVHLVVSQVKREQSSVVVQELYKVIDASELLAIKSQLVTLKVEIFQGLVLTQGLAELSGTLWPEEVTLKLKLS